MSNGPYLETDPVQCDWHTAAFGSPEKVPVYICREDFVALGRIFGAPVEITELHEARMRDESAGAAIVALEEARDRIEELEAQLETAKSTVAMVDVDELLVKLGVPSTMVSGPEPVVEVTSTSGTRSSSSRGGRNGKSSRS